MMDQNRKPKDLPQKLQDDLQKVNKHYKPSSNMNPNINPSHPSAAAVNSVVAKHVKKDAPSVQKVFDDSKERAMYDEIFGSINKSTTPANIPSSTPSSTDFTTSLLSRLKVVEAEAAEARAKLSEQLTLNHALQQEVTHLKTLTNDPVELLQEIKCLKEENANMQDKIDEMEDFLGDYGLVWVGNTGRQNLVKSPISSNGENIDEQVMPFIDFDKAITELNEIIFSEPAQIKKTGDGNQKARLVQASELVEHIRLVYYKNGLMIKNGPFRPCSGESYLSFVQDIMEGYFPSEFQSEYPDGVIFDLIDKREEYYKDNESLTNEKMSRSQFLNRLPKTVIQKGEVIDMRADIGKKLGGEENAAKDEKSSGASNGKVVIDSPAAQHDAQQKHSLGNVVQIQVKWVDRAVFIAKMFEMSTIEDLKKYILEHVQRTFGSWEGDFELRSAFPPRALQCSLTLQEAGLTPNGTVHARKLN